MAFTTLSTLEEHDVKTRHLAESVHLRRRESGAQFGHL